MGEQEWHQVLKHRAAPGKQNLAVRRSVWPSERQPVLSGHVTLGNRYQTSKTRLASQQIVVSGEVQRAAYLISDGQEAPMSIVHELHIHAVGESIAHFSEMSAAAEQICRRPTSLLGLSSDVRNPGGEVCR